MKFSIESIIRNMFCHTKRNCTFFDGTRHNDISVSQINFYLYRFIRTSLRTHIMGKVGSFTTRIVLPVVFAVLSISGIGADGREGRTPQTDSQRSDVLMIDMLKHQGRLERPGVEFPHDLHTQALQKQKKDCTSCHPLTEKKILSLKFQRIKDGSTSETADIYHARCIECHKTTAAANEKSGPVTCGECHKQSPEFDSNRIPIRFDKSLHARHTKAAENKCEACHHEYDAQAKKLFYAKEKESSCRYCHQDVTQDNRISNREASHIACLECHRKVSASGKKAGPVNCGGCHDPKMQAKIEKLTDIPRMPRKQPDTVLMKVSKDVVQPQIRMDFVPFDHKAHEGYSDSCRVCHHQSLNACNTCHTQAGAKEGKWVSLDQAMHRKNTDESCLGCHQQAKSQTNCAGCHARMNPNRKDEQSCRACHIKTDPQPANSLPIPPDQEALIAGSLLNARQTVKAPFSETLLPDIPEKLTLKTLASQYEPVEFPHRKIVQTLFNNITDNKLAEYFHTSQLTLCQGCHHNSPEAVKPPKCQSCHNKPFIEGKDTPGLLGAYHQQCMGCHQAMHIEKPMGCTECHKEKQP